MNKPTDRSGVCYKRISYVFLVSLWLLVLLHATVVPRLTQHACCDLLNKEEKNSKLYNFPGKIH